MGQFIDLTGEKVGRWTVSKLIGYLTKGTIYWECVCECGTVKNVASSSLIKKCSKSCGCLRKELTSKNKKKHGMTNTKTYQAWCSMRRRCYDKNVDRFESYGGRGITVCERWKDSFSNFLEDMGESPTKSHSIDRKNVNGNYEPGNCKWSSTTEQARNTTRQKRKTNGVYRYEDRERWYSLIRVGGRSVYLGYFDSEEAAITARKTAEEKYWK